MLGNRGEVAMVFRDPGVINPREGCRFPRRCPVAIEKCAQVTPRLRPIGPGQVACHGAADEPEDASGPGGAAFVTGH
jgi:peptide/nickel transport system ATP-binding protein